MSEAQTAAKKNGSKADQKKTPDSDVVANLDILMDMDVLENEKNWTLFLQGSNDKDDMPDDLPDLEGGDQ